MKIIIIVWVEKPMTALFRTMEPLFVPSLIHHPHKVELGGYVWFGVNAR